VSENPWIVSARRAELPESNARIPFAPATRIFKRVEKNAILNGSLLFFPGF
jgi:hypothetical protein